MECILHSKDLKEYKADANNSLNRYSISIIYFKINESMNLTSSIKIYLNDGIIPVKIDELLKK